MLAAATNGLMPDEFEKAGMCWNGAKNKEG
jgi:hypothetical protein